MTTLKTNRQVSPSKEKGYVHLELIEWTGDLLANGAYSRVTQRSFNYPSAWSSRQTICGCSVVWMHAQDGAILITRVEHVAQPDVKTGQLHPGSDVLGIELNDGYQGAHRVAPFM